MVFLLHEVENCFSTLIDNCVWCLQRFGSSSIATHLIGAALLRGEWKSAVSMVLEPREGDILLHCWPLIYIFLEKNVLVKLFHVASWLRYLITEGCHKTDKRILQGEWWHWGYFKAVTKISCCRTCYCKSYIVNLTPYYGNVIQLCWHLNATSWINKKGN